MCQLVAYIGDREIAPFLMDVLKLQESYIGAQATGLGTMDNGRIDWVKEPGPVEKVTANSNILGLTGTTGLAHSRLSLTSMNDPRFNRAKNAHPFISEGGDIALMHNGVISNYEEHWAELDKDFEFKGYNPDINYITDSEVAVHMIDKKVKSGTSLADAVRETANSFTGMVLLAAMSVSEPETVYISNWMQPCVLGEGDDETMFASCRIGFNSVEDEFDVFEAPSNSFIKLTRDRIEISKLDATRNALDPFLDQVEFKNVIIELLSKKNALTTVEVMILLEKEGGDRVFGMGPEEWSSHYRSGWGNQNRILGPLEHLAKKGTISKRVEQRMEGGNYVPRFVWSLP